jgi:hypothetical protein
MRFIGLLVIACIAVALLTACGGGITPIAAAGGTERTASARGLGPMSLIQRAGSQVDELRVRA